MNEELVAYLNKFGEMPTLSRGASYDREEYKEAMIRAVEENVPITSKTLERYGLENLGEKLN